MPTTKHSIILLLTLLAFCASSYGQNTKVIRNVNVISMKNSQVLKNRDVFIIGERIAKIEKHNSEKTSPEAEYIDGRGKFLIPGLWDMHVHAWDAKVFLPLFLANGVTGVRDMGGVLEPYVQWRRKTVEDKSFLAPKSYVGGLILNGAPSNVGFFADVRTPEKGRMFVRELKAGGADFVKVYSLLSRDVYDAIADECRRQNITFAGHVPFAVSVTEASEKGQKSLEHLRGFTTAASNLETNLRGELLTFAAPVQKADKLDFPTVKKAFEFEDVAGLDSFNGKKLEKVAAVLRKNNTFVVPTMVVLRGAAMRENLAYRTDERLKYFPSFVKNIIIPAQEPTAAETEQDNKRFTANLEILRILHKQKVKILAGTDAPNPYVFSGFSLHEELEFFVRAGMSPFEALQTATINAAEFTGKTTDLGVIEKGKIADLVLLDANPLESIPNTRRISAVFLDGRYLPKTTLDKMREKVSADYNK
jgi:hypothetical protein